jgi:hypothetical protein
MFALPISVVWVLGLFYYGVRPSAMHINRSCWSPETIAKRAAQLAAEVTVVRVDRRLFLVRLGGTTVVVTVIGAIVGELSQVIHKRVSAATGKDLLWSAARAFSASVTTASWPTDTENRNYTLPRTVGRLRPGNANQLPQSVVRSPTRNPRSGDYLAISG